MVYSICNNKNYQEIIDDVMDYMDFEKIHSVMEFLDWTWAGVDGVPEVPEIRQFLRKLMWKLFNENLNAVSCGGFTVEKHPDYLSVYFVIEEHQVDIEC